MFINFAGQEREIIFNIFGIEQMQDKNEAKSAMADAYALLWGGIEGGRYANEEKKDYTFRQLIDFIDAMDPKERAALIKEATELLTASQAFKSLIPEKEAPKKKAAKSNSATTT